jgi:phosphoglycolate phosphatase
MAGTPGRNPHELQEHLARGTIKAVILDFDGTILDINDPLKKSVTEVFQKYGIFADMARTLIEVGTVLDTVQALPIPKILLESYDIFKMVSAMDQYRLIKKLRVAMSIFSRYQKFAEDAKLCPGVEDLLKALASRTKLFIVSHNRTNKIQDQLAKFGLAKYFTGVFGVDQLPALKPDPESVAFAAAQVRPYKPEEIVVIGDMPTDIQAGAAAGFWTVGVSTGFIPHEHLQVVNPDVLVHNFPEFIDSFQIGRAPIIEVVQQKRGRRA